MTVWPLMKRLPLKMLSAGWEVGSSAWLVQRQKRGLNWGASGDKGVEVTHVAVRCLARRLTLDRQWAAGDGRGDASPTERVCRCGDRPSRSGR